MRLVVSTYSMSGFPFEADAVSELDQKASNVATLPSLRTADAYSAMRPVSPLCVSMTRTILPVFISSLSLGPRTCGSPFCYGEIALELKSHVYYSGEVMYMCESFVEPLIFP